MYWTLNSIYMQFEYQYPKSSNVSVDHVQLGQSFKTVGYGCTSCWGDVGAGDAEADVIYIAFIVSVQHVES